MSQRAPVRALVWSEWTEPKNVYPNGIHGAIAEALNACEGITASTAHLNEPEQGLSEARLASADVLFWFGHGKHGAVEDAYVERVVRRVTQDGMGFVPVHSAHYSKPFKALMGLECGLGGWREDDKSERVKVLLPDHPIAKGVADFVIPHDEMYSEPFAVPDPEAVVLYSYFEGGEEFRSGCCWTRGKGRIFYFRPGHETCPVYFQPEVKVILCNAALWTAHRT